MYVTTDKIRVNKRRVQPLAKTGMFVALAGLVGFAVPPILIPALVVAIASRLYERKTSRQKWPSIDQIGSGQKRLDVKRQELLRIDLKAPRILRYGYAKIVPLIGEPVVLSIARNKNFILARDIFIGFDPARVYLAEPV